MNHACLHAHSKFQSLATVHTYTHKPNSLKPNLNGLCFVSLIMCVGYCDLSFCDHYIVRQYFCKMQDEIKVEMEVCINYFAEITVFSTAVQGKIVDT